MATALKVVGWLLMAAAFGISVQFIVWPLEGNKWPLEAIDGSTAWQIFDVVMLVGYLAALVVAIRRFVTSQGSTDIVERVFSAFMPMMAIGGTILFIEQYFTVVIFAADGYQLTDVRGQVWQAVDILFVLTSGWAGIHLIRGSSEMTE